MAQIQKKFIADNAVDKDKLDLSDSYDFATGLGSVRVLTQSVGNSTTLAASTEFVDNTFAAVPLVEEIKEVHVISSGETAAGFFTLAQNPADVTKVCAWVTGGPHQSNKSIDATSPDFQILNTNEFHFNDNGAGTGLTGDLTTGDEINVVYTIDGSGSGAAATAVTPGGSDTHVQYNNSGAFGGISEVTWNGSRLQINSGQVVKCRSVTSTDTILATDYILECSGTFVLNITAVASLEPGQIFHVFNAGTGSITIDPNLAETINGNATYVLNTQYESAVIKVSQSGTEFFVL